MLRLFLATALSLMCGSAFAQGSTGPAPQSDNMPKPGMANSGKNSGSMNDSTTGMSRDAMPGQGMNKPVGGASKDGQGMSKGGANTK